MSEARWYVVHTYSGYENKVKLDIEKTIENRNLRDQILEVVIPMESVEEEKGDSKKVVTRKLLPAYILIHMVMNDDTWYVVRNTRGVTGFVGPGSKPVPLSDEDVEKMMSMYAVQESPFKIGDSVIVTDGVWEDTVGVVQSVNDSRRIVTINVNMFGRETPFEIDFASVKKV